MSMRIRVSVSKNSGSYRIIDDYTNFVTHKRSTFIIESLDSLSTLQKNIIPIPRKLSWTILNRRFGGYFGISTIKKVLTQKYLKKFTRTANSNKKYETKIRLLNS